MSKIPKNHDSAFAKFAHRMNRDSRKAMIDYPPFVFWDKGLDQADIQNAIMHKPDTLFNKLMGLYVHIPFCAERCTFCRYPFYMNTARINDFLEALFKEIDIYAGLLKGSPIRSVMFGGGTPSILDENQLQRALSRFHETFNLKNTLQISFEAHPASLNREKLKILNDFRVNRISIGLQSLDPQVLKNIHRTQDTAHAKDMYDAAHEAGIRNVHIDLMVGLPGQTVASFVKDLKEILSWRPSSITVYEFLPSSLTLFSRMGNTHSHDDLESMKTMNARAAELFHQAGYIHKPGNSTAQLEPGVYTLGVVDAFKYNSSFLGLGPFSNSHLTGAYRYANFGNLNDYIKAVDKGELPVERGVKLDMNKEVVSYLFTQLWKGAVSKRAIELLYGAPLDAFPGIVEKLNYLESRKKITLRGHSIKSHMTAQEDWLTYSQYLFDEDIQQRILELAAAGEPGADTHTCGDCDGDW